VVSELVVAVPGDLATATGGFGYDRRIIAELAALGWKIEVLDLGCGFPRPTAAMRAAASRRLAALPRQCPIIVDGLVFGVLPETAEMLRESHRLVALVHHPLALETGLSVDEAARLRASERAALTCARHVVVSSATTMRILAEDFHVPIERLSVVEPGTDKPATQSRARAGVVALLSVGSVVPRKGYDVLVAALAKIGHLPWRLVIVGDCTRSAITAQQLRAEIARLGLAERIILRGVMTAEELSSLYARSDLFVLPSRFEGYGMAFAEAIAHGLPVVGTKAGAIAQTVPGNAGVLVPVDDAEALANALQRLIEKPQERERFAAGARAAIFPSWREQGARFARVLEGLA
jgi:glycosyltransferase involved in cell wall biosynthesis